MSIFSDLDKGLWINKYWILANVVEISLYLYFSSRGWGQVGSQGLPGGPGTPIVWALSIFPVIVVSAIGNLLWFVLILLKVFQGGRKVSLAIFFAFCLMWIGAFYYSGARQYKAGVLLSAPFGGQAVVVQ